MEEKPFVPLGLQSPEAIQAKLEEIGDLDKAVSYGLESAARQRPWLDTQHQYGFIAPFTPGTQRYHPIQSATNMAGDETLRGQRINIRLDYLRIYDYPTALFNPTHNVHTILFTFEARNQVENDKEEPVAFNQLYKARTKQDAAVAGQPVFIGLTVGMNGVGFTCKTVNVANSTDEDLVNIFESDAVTSGLNLLTTAQPALTPLTTLARGLCVSLASHNRNVPVQEVRLGLDFDTGFTGGRLAVGSYVVAQTARPDEIVWSEWAYDAETGTITRDPQSLPPGEKPYPLPHNAFVFRVSRYTS
ncbi:MAG TPA: hypothetical protein PLH19_14960 [Anaerolineae bacterium]|nr:hypothetical protein [Anaerolineae bacterium]HQH39815.1 hypothetical protein [Anaerolineae bacterium]